jgi:hypothetical protein
MRRVQRSPTTSSAFANAQYYRYDRIPGKLPLLIYLFKFYIDLIKSSV